MTKVILSFTILLLMFFHNVFLTHYFNIKAIGLNPVLQKNVYDGVLVWWGGAILFAGIAAGPAIFSVTLMIALLHYFSMKKLFVITAGITRPRVRIRIYDTALFTCGGICAYTGMYINPLL